MLLYVAILIVTSVVAYKVVRRVERPAPLAFPWWVLCVEVSDKAGSIRAAHIVDWRDMEKGLGKTVPFKDEVPVAAKDLLAIGSQKDMKRASLAIDGLKGRLRRMGNPCFFSVEIRKGTVVLSVVEDDAPHCRTLYRVVNGKVVVEGAAIPNKYTMAIFWLPNAVMLGFFAIVLVVVRRAVSWLFPKSKDDCVDMTGPPDLPA